MARIGFLEKPTISGIKKIILPNGFTIFLEELPNQEDVIFSVGIGAGSRDEPPELQGINHFLEHIQFRSNCFRTTDEIIEDVEDGGACFNAGIDFDSTMVYVLGSSRYLSRNIRIIYETITNLKYQEQEIENDRQEILTELRSYIDDPGDHYLDNLFIPTLFRKTYLERPVLGTKKSIKRITTDDLIAFKKKFYVSSNMAIFVCGKFDEGRVIRTIEKTFGRLKPPLFEKKEWEKNFKNRHRELPYKKRKGIKLAYLALGFKVPGFNHPDSLRLILLESIFSAGMSSRLFKRLRSERGIGYRDLGGVYDDYGGIGAFYVTVGGLDSRRIKEAKNIILAELEDLKNNLVSKREFLRAKNLFFAQKGRELRNLEDRAEMLSNAYFRKSIFDPRNYKKHIGKISREAVRRVAQKYFDDKYTLTALVPENFEK